MCPDLYTNVMLQYSIKIEFIHPLQLFGPVVECSTIMLV